MTPPYRYAEVCVETLVDGLTFLEGPRWRAGRLFISDFYQHAVYAIDGRGDVTTICQVENQPSGLGFTPDGDLLVVSMLDKKLLKLGGEVLSEVADLTGLAGGPLNDMVVDHYGRAYIGNFGSDVDGGESLAPTRLIRVDPDGSTARVGDDLIFPNGMVVRDDARTLIVAESYAQRISTFDIEPDGALTRRRTLMEFGRQMGGFSVAGAIANGAIIPDGLAQDAEGGLWVADAGGQCARRYVGGVLSEVVPSGERAVYAVALGGPDGHTLFMTVAPRLGVDDRRLTNRAGVLSCRVRVPAAPHAG